MILTFLSNTIDAPSFGTSQKTCISSLFTKRHATRHHM